ncbi:MAG: TIR domain-containing protein [Nitrospinae bacterium]|nr:TIR domain-containing protein [Nitrospinota bacterium]
MPDNSHKRQYDVVISFAGEDRDHAGRLAELLKHDGFEVFYDEDEEADLWGKNLYEHLTEVYSKLGKYCVMFLSKHYAAKQWPTLERRAAQERAFKENREYILPIRLDDTEIPGILDTVGYQDLREKTIEEIYGILKKKLQIHG